MTLPVAVPEQQLIDLLEQIPTVEELLICQDKCRVPHGVRKLLEARAAEGTLNLRPE